MSETETPEPILPEVIPPLTPEVAQNALEFLRRTDLKGAEVDAFVRVRASLLAIASQS